MNIEMNQNRIDIPVVPQVSCDARPQVMAFNFKPNPGILNRTTTTPGKIEYNTGDFTDFAPNEVFKETGVGKSVDLTSRADGVAVTNAAGTRVLFSGTGEQTPVGRAIVVTIERIGGESRRIPVACGAEPTINFFIHRSDLDINSHVVDIPLVKKAERTPIPAVDPTKEALAKQVSRLSASATQQAIKDLLDDERIRGIEAGKRIQAVTEATKTAIENKDKGNPWVIDVNTGEVIKYLVIVGLIFGAVAFVNALVAPRVRR